MNTSNQHEVFTRATDFKKFPFRVSSLTRHKMKKRYYYDFPVAFDIETSSFNNEDGDPRACMYVWQMCFGDVQKYGFDCVVVGRTWEEFDNFMKKVRVIFRLNSCCILPIYVHNLAYESAFIKDRFEWSGIFALDKRVPLYMRSVNGFEFRCSYRLSGYSLKKVAENLTSHNMRKLDTLDYEKTRHFRTPIEPDEMDYNIMDVKIVCAYISECLEKYGNNITKLPLTKTGVVRNACRLACYGSDQNSKQFENYRKTMQRLTITPHEYKLLKCAFSGGFTHANAFYNDKILKNVTSYDFTSSYPYVMVSELFPWSKGEQITEITNDELLKNLDVYAWIIDIKFYGLESIIMQDDYLSWSKRIGENADKSLSEYAGETRTLNNGRVNKASYFHTVITSIDLKMILQCYRFERFEIVECYRYKKAYLPTDFINCVLDFYEAKNILKGIEGKEVEYLHGKESLNSTYGMMVTDVIRDEITYNTNPDNPNTWESNPVDVPKAIEKYNKSRNRFTFFPVGLFITAYARYNLWTGILNCGADYVYSDTDSIKILNADKHADYINAYNEDVKRKLKRACEFHNIPWEKVAPKTKKGVEKILGVWDCESTTPNTPTYSRFKTLGAKRYMTEDYTTGEISLTVAGLNKKRAIPYLLQTYGKEGIFNAFTFDDETGEGLIVPSEFSGRTVATYIDTPTRGTVVDYLGHKARYYELSAVNLRQSEYTLSLGKEYLTFLLGKRETPITN